VKKSDQNCAVNFRHCDGATAMLPTSIEAIRALVPREKRIVLVGGSFDLLHVGHLHVLNFAKQHADVLVVAVLSDTYVRGYKGPGRPVIKEAYRLAMVEALKCVDHAYISGVNSSDPATLRVLEPKLLVFGIEGDKESGQKLEAKVRDIQGSFSEIEIMKLPRFHDKSLSTSAIIQKMASQ
jgi:cytidyltransferase-like protein